MAFVLVQHLAPDHKSLLCELVAGFTSMPVQEIEDGMALQANQVYILPPNYDLDFLHGAFHLLPPGAPHGQRLPIDYFFASLALEMGARAVGIVLAGTGADGSQGLSAIKSAGGMVVAQVPAPPEFEGMPQSAIATGLVDFQLAPADMAAQLIAYGVHREKTLKAGAQAKLSAPALRQALALLHTETGHDFSHYKPSTIHRRIERRMAVHQVDSVQAYAELLKQQPAELKALLQDLLIGVTRFFRDTEAFDFLEAQVVPALFEGKGAGDAVRVWCTACSTGQEAYSVAMLLVERMEALKLNFVLQVFATDMDSRAIAFARVGVYPLSIAAEVSPERLAKFFTLEPGGQSYRIHKRIRDVLVFSEQDVIKDPPFSRLDLICCRNLLIYLDTFLQKRLIPLFHYALLPGGFLFLGSSEGIGEFEKLFVVRDRNAKVFQRKQDLQSGHGAHKASIAHAQEPATGPAVPAEAKARPSALAKPVAKPLLRAVMEQALLRQVTPASVLVNGSGDVLYVHGHTGLFLEPSQGEVGVQNILKMAHAGLRTTLSSALREVQKNGHVFKATQFKFVVQGLAHYVDITVQRLARNHAEVVDTALYLVTLDERPAPVPPAAQEPPAAGDKSSASVQALTQALREKDEYLQSTQEALESANEALRSSVEEMQSVNEELQSANEELETSKEELQSVNEELATVNTELQTKVNDLSRSNNDMNNLLAGTGVGTVFVDMHLKILRFTPAVAPIMNLIPSDLGRSVSHIASNLVGYTSLVADVKGVLHSLEPMALEVQTSEDTWYTLHIQPYRTLSNVVEGAVISFENITEMVRARAALEKANDLLRLAVVDAHGRKS